ncbi:hypothetical protein [Cellulomonas xylanilytica]|uniref:Secreted protein n=1 Tax=Cellulomonas xylanilytica TaxID=233583 RepID=A0A510V7A6_9CELL|nr:hypothetical protein [Cellulomonas xylanilytica]GEK21025.1 hypothetical protein CXY01_15450 [Cellulomonas xylanilytica]
MTTVTHRLRAVAAVLVIAASATLGIASPTSAATHVTRTVIRGPLIQAQADVLDGCIEQHLYVQAMQDSTGQPLVLVLDSRVDVCGGNGGSFAEGTAVPTLLQVHPSLSSAHLVASVPLLTPDGRSAGTVELDLTFTGTGATTRTHFRQSVTDPTGGTTYTFTDRSTSRSATATGEPDVAFGFAAIGILKQGEVVRTRT